MAWRPQKTTLYRRRRGVTVLCPRPRLGRAMNFRDTLPNGCPPNHASEEGYSQAFRLLSAAKPELGHFLPNSAEKQCPTGVDPCRWASCSLYTNLDTLRKKRQTFPRLRKMLFFAEISIAANSGKIVHENDHLDFWMFFSFDPIKAISKVAAL
jgi:hypothetical protein